jgi:iron complex outermembrane recepter protein
MVKFRGNALRARLICGAASLAVLTAISGFSAHAQTASEPAAGEGDQVVVVTGVRASLQSAMRLKKNSDQIQESVTAEDIGKMPDNNLAETLQRLTGVQMNRNLGEGKYISIRGLTQVQSELNGRPVFSADGDGRSLNYESVPAELLAGADVYKSPMADQIDGGIGGLVNFRTRRPFDFKGLKVAGGVRASYGDQIKSPSFSKSILVSNRWDTSIGEVGALLAVSDGHREFQRNFTKNADFKARALVDSNGNNLYPNKTCGIPGSALGTVCYSEANYTQPNQGFRDRTGTNLSLQWKPNSQTEVYLDAVMADFKSTEKVLGSFPCPACASSLVATDVVFSTERPADVVSATYANVPLINDNYYGKNSDKDRQVAVGVKWTGDKWNFLAEVTAAETTHKGYFMLLEQTATAPQMKFDVRTAPTTYSFPGFDLTNPANWRYAQVGYGPNEARGDQTAAKWDAEYQFDGSWLKSVKFGMRYAQESHSADSVGSWNGVNGPVLGGNSIGLHVSSHTDLFDSIPKAWVAPDLDVMASPDYVFAVFGLTPPKAWDPHNHFEIDEKTLASYVMAEFEGNLGVPYSGNVGVRYISTDDAADGWLVTNGVYSPYQTSTSYNDILPSVNVKFDLSDDLKLRLAASKVLTRPPFPSLNPTVTLSPFFHTASGGNPALEPLRADQLDASLEYYFSSTGYLYGAAFYKNVSNFIFTSQGNETYNGETYLTTRPGNGADGKIKGLELGYQDFFTNLPAPFDGLGVIANATYIDSQTPSPVQPGTLSPLPQLSQYSYNLIGIYEKGPISLRVAYNWRDQFVETYTGANGGIQAEIRKAYGILDMSGSYKLNDHLSVTFDAQNLSQPLRQTFYTIESHPAEFQTEDRYYSIGLRFNY